MSLKGTGIGYFKPSHQYLAMMIKNEPIKNFDHTHIFVKIHTVVGAEGGGAYYLVLGRL